MAPTWYLPQIHPLLLSFSKNLSSRQFRSLKYILRHYQLHWPFTNHTNYLQRFIHRERDKFLYNNIICAYFAQLSGFPIQPNICNIKKSPCHHFHIVLPSISWACGIWQDWPDRLGGLWSKKPPSWRGSYFTSFLSSVPCSAQGPGPSAGATRSLHNWSLKEKEQPVSNCERKDIKYLTYEGRKGRKLGLRETHSCTGTTCAKLRSHWRQHVVGALSDAPFEELNGNSTSKLALL